MIMVVEDIRKRKNDMRSDGIMLISDFRIMCNDADENTEYHRILLM